MTSPRSTIRSNQSSRTGRFAIGAAASAALVATFGFAAPAAAEETTEEPSSAELLEKIEELQKQVEQLQETQEETSEQLSAAEVDAAVSRVLDDAEARSELLSMQGFTAGHDGKGFVLKDDSGDNKLNLGFQFQFRWVSNLMDGEDGDFGTGSFDSDEFVSDEGFQMRRVRLKAKGNVISPKLKYNLNYALEANDLLDFDVKYELNDNLTLQFGQYKTPLHF
ncbi:MAG: porin, partial [Planctomycetota bacterium]